MILIRSSPFQSEEDQENKLRVQPRGVQRIIGEWREVFDLCRPADIGATIGDLNAAIALRHALGNR